MIDGFSGLPKVVGLKQSKKTIKEGKAQKVFAARDASEKVLSPVLQLSLEQGIEVDQKYTMAELGELCGIDVGASVVTILKDSF